MTAGYQLTFTAVNDGAGALCVRARDLFDDVTKFKAQLDGFTDAQLLAAPVGMAQADIDNLRSALADLAQLGTIWRGSANLATAKDFTNFTKRLTGVF